jgi:Ser-tRNA(Ala) deacylase AlaX
VREITEKVYLKDAYRKEIEAVVTAVNSKEIELDRTIFYPTGGGVLNDTGTISLNGNGYKDRRQGHPYS